ncbi:MAG: hypothetical protein ABIP94_25885 [Planctomycetota bacterium]
MLRRAAAGGKPMTTTARDLLQQAAGAANDIDRHAALERAEVAAQFPSDLVDIAEVWVAAGGRAAAARCLAAALQQGADDVWIHRRAAATWLSLGDPTAAVLPLVALETRFGQQRGTRGSKWRLLAEGFAELLQDTDAARRCLEAGCAGVADPDDCCSMAQGFAYLLDDRDTARQLTLRAEELATSAGVSQLAPDCFAFWTIANTWKNVFGDDVRARANFEQGLAAAGDVEDCATMAAGWASHEHEAGEYLAEIRHCLAKGKALAATFDDWFRLAEATRQHDRDADRVRECLRRAQPLATPAQQRQLARALRDWLGLEAEAAAIGPVGLTPQQIMAPGPTRYGWNRDIGTLLTWLRSRITEPALEEIAMADYGNDRREHLAVLHDVWRTGLVPVPLAWHPREVLSLYHWREGADVDHGPRAFCCTLLCIAALTAAHSVEDALVRLVESCLVLGDEALVRLPGFLVAFLDERPSLDVGDRAFGALALLLVATRLDRGDVRLERLATELLACEVSLAATGGYVHPKHGFLLGTTHFDQSMHVWRALVHDMLADIGDPNPASALAHLVRRLRG